MNKTYKLMQIKIGIPVQSLFTLGLVDLATAALRRGKDVANPTLDTLRSEGVSPKALRGNVIGVTVTGFEDEAKAKHLAAKAAQKLDLTAEPTRRTYPSGDPFISVSASGPKKNADEIENDLDAWS